MYIKDIILDGFKCYENKTIIKNLDKSYNAITGLNGSGKSNIIDAIVFTLGLESKKLLRASSMKDLINVHRKDCRVTLILSNFDKSKSPPGYKDLDEILISRSIDSTGKSKYFLNNHSCTLNTLNKLCSSIGINSDKGELFFIIMQGHITKVLNMKSNEIRNLIEETAGTRSYTKEKEKGLQILEKKENKLKEVRDTLERRISPFYNRLREEREAYVQQRNIEEVRKKYTENIKKLQEKIVVGDISKIVGSLKDLIESYVVDMNDLVMLEEKLQELQEVDSEVDIVNIKEMLEDEKIKLDYIRNSPLDTEIDKLEKEFKSIKIDEKKYNLEELKQKEKILLKDIKSSTMSFGSNSVDKIEKLENLKTKRSELMYKLKSLNAGPEFNEERIKEIERYKADNSELFSKKNRLNYLRSKINYPFIDEVYGTIDENIILPDQKYKECVFTVLGNKAKHVIVSNEKIASDILKKADRRISVIPLNKIKAKIIQPGVIKAIKEQGGLHMIDLIKYDYKLKKAMEHVFNGFFVFENKNSAKKICFEKNVMCITLDGIVYDPKGTLTGGKTTFKSEIISKNEIDECEKIIKRLEQNQRVFEDLKNEYNDLLNARSKLQEKIKVESELKGIDSQIKIFEDINHKDLNVREEISHVRKLIVEATNEENNALSLKKKRDRLEKEIQDLKEKKEKEKGNEEDCLNKIDQLKRKLGEFEIRTSTKKMSEKQIEGLEPKQKYLIKTTSKLYSRISKIYQEYSDLVSKLQKFGPIESYLLPENSALFSNQWVNNFIFGKYEQFYVKLNIGYEFLKFNVINSGDKEENRYKAEINELNTKLEKLNSSRTVRMDPANFDLLEKNELIIKSLKEKITKLEEDRQNILSSINNFDSLGIKENEKAFQHINNRLGNFLRYFIKDSDAKIIKNKDYELKVKIGNWKESLSELSGGQRSLVALCLIFSTLTYKPAPFYIFDEIDSALDLSYTQSIGEIIKQEFLNSQFIIISLKNGMFENANSVYKVFLKEGKSKICQIK